MMRVRAAGLIVKGDALLLVNHTKRGRSYWLLPGGGVKLGEDIKTALKREIHEEINLDGTVRDLLFVFESFSSQEDHVIQPTYYVEAANLETLQLGADRRVAGFGFFDSRDIENLTIYPDIKDELREFLGKKIFRRRYLYKEWIQ
jgi:8-oxo-dGTP diphosphatase